VRAALDRARAGEGPTFIEAVTYRIGAHSTSDDPARYRSQAEVDVWAARDPLDRLRRHLSYLGLVSDAGDEAMDRELSAEIAAVIDEVEALPPQARESLFDDVYKVMPWHLQEEMRELKKVQHDPTGE
jgi:pyruvate dehydrogenase E1 component alpha subunit